VQVDLATQGEKGLLLVYFVKQEFLTSPLEQNWRYYVLQVKKKACLFKILLLQGSHLENKIGEYRASFFNRQDIVF